MGSRSSTTAAGPRCSPTPTSPSSTSTPKAAPRRIPRCSRRSTGGWSKRSWRPRAPRLRPNLSSSGCPFSRPLLYCGRTLDPKGGPLEPFPDLPNLSDDDLKHLIDDLTRQEHEVSYQRRLLHARIDLLRTELVARLQKT